MDMTSLDLPRAPGYPNMLDSQNRLYPNPGPKTDQ